MYLFVNFTDSVVKTVYSEAATEGLLCEKVFLKFAKFTGKQLCQSPGKQLCQSLFFNKFEGLLTSLLIVLT